MKALRVGAVLAGLAVWALWTHDPRVGATNHDVFISEAMAGANGNSRVQFIEIKQLASGQNCWGPQVAPLTSGADADDSQCFTGLTETRSRAMLVFFDAQDREIGRFKFPENPPTTGAGAPDGGTVLVATPEFAALPGAPAPNFIMPAMMSPVNGKVCFKGNPENASSLAVNLCLSYGSAFAGSTEGAGLPAPALPTTNAQSLGRTGATHDNQNSQFALGVPSPTNFLGQTFTFPVVTQVLQGQTLFDQETFMGNGRTCAQCHVASISRRLDPANMAGRFTALTAPASTSFDPLFIAETFLTGFDFNLNTLQITAAPTPPGGTDFLNPSGGDLQGIITGAGGVRAKVLTRVNATTYRIYGGLSPALSGTVTDASGNQATVGNVLSGGLNALETPARMRQSVVGAFPNGRALILENIDGFANPPVFRKSPHLLNLSRTAPYGFSGDIPDLREFSTGAVRQHFPRTLARDSAISSGSNPDFRLPTGDELAALEAFMLAQEFPAGNDPDKFNVNHFLSTPAQVRGRDLFFGSRAKCSMCHGGPVLSTTTVSIQGKAVGINASFNTGVTRQGINTLQDHLPCEPSVGTCHTREFSVPPLFNLKNLAPFFHDASAANLLGAVFFYLTNDFRDSPAGIAIGGVDLAAIIEPDDIVAFLEALTTPVPPSVSVITNPTILEDTPSGALAFTVAPASATLSASSSNTALIPNANVAFGGTNSLNRTVTVTPALNQVGSSTITVTATDLGATATRTFTVTVNSVNDAPTITTISDLTVAEDSTPGPISFVIGDVDTPLFALTVSTSTTAPTLHTTSVDGAAASRTLTIVPLPNQTGSATVTVSVSDGVVTTNRQFQLTVTPVNDPPAISAVADQVAASPTVGPLAVTLSDIDTPVGTLSLSAASSNPSLIPSANVIIGGSGADRTLTLQIPFDVSGSAVMTLTAGDGVLQTTRAFTVTVPTAFPSPPPPPPPPSPPAPSPPPPAPPPPAVLPPGAPSGLSAAVQGAAIVLNWVAAPASDEQTSDLPVGDLEFDAATGYRIEVGTAAGQSNAATFTTGVTTTFTVTGLAPGRYFIRVRGFNGGGDGAASNEVTATIADPGGGPGAPRNLRASLSGRAAILAWDPPGDGLPVLGYAVEAGSASGQANLGVATVAGLALTLDNIPDGTYFFRVKALRSAGPGPASNEVTITVGTAPPAPCTVAPGAPVLSGGASGGVAVLSWIPSAAGGPATGYVLQAGSAPGLTDIASVALGGAVTSFSASAPAGTYFIRVVAVNTCGPSPASNEVTMTIGGAPLPPGAAPGAPGGLTAQVIGSRVTLSWSPPVSGGAASRYILDVSDAAGNPLLSIDTGNPATTFTHASAPSGTFVVRVRAANSAGIGPPSAPVTVIVP